MRQSSFLPLIIVCSVLGLILGGCVSGGGSQPPAKQITWAKSYGAQNEDRAQTVQQTTDGGYIVAGTSSGYSDKNDPISVVKLSPLGDVEWEKSFGGRTFAARQVSDGGYVVAGQRYVIKDQGLLHADPSLWRLDPLGNVIWQRAYRTDQGGGATYIRETSDGGFIILGDTWWTDWCMSVPWIMKVDSVGGVEWYKLFSTENGCDDGIFSVEQTKDVGYIAAGIKDDYGSSTDPGGPVIWMLRFDSAGTVEWNRFYQTWRGTLRNTDGRRKLYGGRFFRT